MKGIIVRPKPCCGYSGSIGLIVQAVGKAEKGKPGICFHCNKVISPEGHVVLLEGDYILENRVKWFPDFKEDLLIEEKEKEEV